MPPGCARSVAVAKHTPHGGYSLTPQDLSVWRFTDPALLAAERQAHRHVLPDSFGQPAPPEGPASHRSAPFFGGRPATTTSGTTPGVECYGFPPPHSSESSPNGSARNHSWGNAENMQRSSMPQEQHLGRKEIGAAGPEGDGQQAPGDSPERRSDIQMSPDTQPRAVQPEMEQPW